ncbi:MAG: ABC transporter permease [Candidatus Woesearchaeota archaeon]
MKIAAIIKRNLKLIIRSKSSALILLILPIIIMVAVGLAFNTSEEGQIKVGYIEGGNLTGDFVNLLDNDNYTLNFYDDEEDCRDAIGQGNIHICIIFPEEFEIENNKKNEIRYLVDNSQVNFFRSVVQSITADFNEKAKEYSSGLTSEVLSKLNSTTGELKAKASVVNELTEGNKELAEGLTELRTVLDFSTDVGTDIDVDSLRINSVLSDMEQPFEDLVADTEKMISDIDSIASGLRNDSKINESEYSEIQSILSNTEGSVLGLEEDFYEEYNSSRDSFNERIDQVKGNLSAVKSLLNSIDQKRGHALDRVDQIETLNAKNLERVMQIQDTFLMISANIESTDVTDLETIISPIDQKVEPVIAEDTQLNFYFPYLIILIFTFIGVLLASSLMLMEKFSQAYFRNFVTPTRDSTFLFGTFLTTLTIIFFEASFIIGVYAYFFKKDVLTNLSVTLLILLISASIFILIGMLIGIFSQAGETSMLSAISLISIMIFLSDLIFPLERMPFHIANLISLYNPFYVSSDLLRKALIHKVSFSGMQHQLLMLFVICIGLCVAMVGLYKLVKRHIMLRFSGYIARRDVKRVIRSRDLEELHERMKKLPASKYFTTKDSKKIKNLEELRDHIQEQKGKDFYRYVGMNKNLYADWIGKKLGNESLAEQLYTTRSKRKTLKYLNKAIEEFKEYDK